jgi:CHASE2 domain-containing sensor protein
MSATGGPYVGLDYFAEEDAGLFFGRDDERKRISGNLRASRLTLLYAESGVGKSSLLRAGVSARLRQHAVRNVIERGRPGLVPVVFSSWRGDPTADLIAALEEAARPLLQRDDVVLRRDTLDHAIEDVAASAAGTPLVILDQFEEHFLDETDTDERFDEALARCVNRRDLRANFLIAIREDAYSLIGSRFKAHIPNVYANFLHLDFLDAEAARTAILQPLAAFNTSREGRAAPVSIEPELVDAVIDQVRRGRVAMGDAGTAGVEGHDRSRVETAYLQLVMKRLWDEEIGLGSDRLRLETLRRLGGADTIVHGHLDDAMARLPAPQRDAATAALRFLVTSAGRKIALSSDELREFTDVDAATLDPALEHLERERILRPVPATEPGGAARHEIFHDVLAPAIRDWRRAEAERRLERVRRRARRLERRNRVLSAAVIALAALAVGLALYLWNPGPVRRLELAAFDARLTTRGGRASDPRVVIVAVDDRTLRRFGADRRGRLPRVVYARIVDRLRADAPRVIAVDVNFEGRRDVPGDRALLTAIRRTQDRIVLGYRSAFVTDKSSGVVSTTADLFGRTDDEVGVVLGWAGVPNDPDAKIRRAEYLVGLSPSAHVADLDPLGVPAAPRSVPTFAFAAANLARGGKLAPRVNELPSADRSAWGGQPRRSTWIDFDGPAGTVRRVSAVDLLAGRVRPQTFRKKLVVVGVTTSGSPDVHATPLDEGRPMPGVELQANAIATMVDGSPLRNTTTLVDVLAILLLGAVPALAGASRSPRRTTVAIVAAVIAFLAAAVLAFQAGWILAVVAPLAALAAATVGLVVRSGRRALARRRAAAPQADATA